MNGRRRECNPRIISPAKSEPFHSLLNQESYFYPSPPLFLSPFPVGAYGVLSLHITPHIRTRLDGLSTALRIAALRPLLELILKAVRVWRSTDLLNSCQADGARRIHECTCAGVLVAHAHVRRHSRTFTPWDLKGGEWFLSVHCVLVEIKII